MVCALGVLCPKACERDARARVPATAAAQGLSRVVEESCDKIIDRSIGGLVQ